MSLLCICSVTYSKHKDCLKYLNEIVCNKIIENDLIESNIIEHLYQLNANCKYFVPSAILSF